MVIYFYLLYMYIPNVHLKLNRQLSMTHSLYGNFNLLRHYTSLEINIIFNLFWYFVMLLFLNITRLNFRISIFPTKRN